VTQVNAATRPWLFVLCLTAIALSVPQLSYGVTAPVSDDASAIRGIDDSSGKAPSLAVGGRSRAYLRFDLSSLPSGVTGAEIAKATIRVWVNRVSTPGSLDVYRLREDWSESRIKRRRAPRLAEPVYEGLPVTRSNEQGFLTIDVTALAAGWVDGAFSNQGVALVAGSPDTNIGVDSKENKAGGHEPELEITLDFNAAGGGSTSTLPVLGPPGPPGPDGPQGLTGPPGAALNQMRIAMLRWWDANLTGINAPTGNQPSGLMFDGVDLWVTNFADDTLKKHRTVNGSVIGFVGVGAGPSALAFDGVNIWITNETANTVQKLQAINGSVLGTYAVGTAPKDLAFDGTYMWVVNSGSDDISQVRASDGMVMGTYPVGTNPQAVIFDGTDIWVSNTGDNTVVQVRTSDGAIIDVHSTGNAPLGLAYDGRTVWVAESGDGTVSRLESGELTPDDTIGVGSTPTGIVFDGEFIWVTNNGSNSVTKVQISNGAVRGTYPTGAGPTKIAFDGSSIWVLNAAANTLSKL